jgi:hypothetical protein
MLQFPDSNSETQYTDPNGSQWEFNGTGWVRQPASSGGGGGGFGGATQGSPAIPDSGMINVNKRFGYNTRYNKTSNNGLGTISFGNDVYRIWRDGSDIRYDHHTLEYTDKDNYTETQVTDMVTVAGMSKWVGEAPYIVRIGPYAFRSFRGGDAQYYIKQNDDKTLSFLDFKTLESSYSFQWGAFVNSRGNLVIAYVNTGNVIRIREYSYDSAADELVALAPSYNYGSFFSTSGLFAMMETPYGYFFTDCHADGQTSKYRFRSVDKDFNLISSEQNNGVVHELNNTTSIRVPARYRNGLGIGWAGVTNTSKSTTTAGPVVNEDGTFPTQIMEKNGSYGRYELAGKWFEMRASTDKFLGVTGLGGTTSRYFTGPEEYNYTDNKYLNSGGVASELLMDAYFINEAGNRRHRLYQDKKVYQGSSVMSGSWPVPSDIEGLWFSGHNDSNIHILEEKGNSEIGTLKQRAAQAVRDTAMRIKRAVDAKKKGELK